MEALQNQLEKIGDQQATIQALRDQVRRRSHGSSQFSKLTMTPAAGHCGSS